MNHESSPKPITLTKVNKKRKGIPHYLKYYLPSYLCLSGWLKEDQQ